MKNDTISALKAAYAAILIGVAVVCAGASAAQARDKVTFMTAWRAEVEHAGFYQALATGIYEKYGLDVDVQMGGPQIDASALLIAGKVDFIMASSLAAIHYAQENLPFLTVAAPFQKDPQVLVAHSGVGNDTMQALKGKPVYLGASSRSSFWPFLRARYGYTDEQIRPFTFDYRPFFADPTAIAHAFITAMPPAQGFEGKPPVVFLLADSGWDNYALSINTSRNLVETNPDLVQRFVSASIEGWASYLHGDPTPGNNAIKKDNPDYSDNDIALAMKGIKDYGLVDSGDAKTMGIGAMTDERWKRLIKTGMDVGAFPTDPDYSKAYTLQFVDKKVGM
jgi:NitT/TauT family transport system substrate-binding protein